MLKRSVAVKNNHLPMAQADIAPSLSLAIETSELTQRSSANAAPAIAILGAKGGSGASTLAVNLALQLSAWRSTTLIDANFQHPDLAHIVGGLKPAHSIMELLEHRGDKPDRQMFTACCSAVSEVNGGMHLLSPPIDGRASLKTNLSELADCLSLIRSFSGMWVIDLPRHLNKHLVKLLDACQKILLVFEASVTGVAASHRWLNVFSELGYDHERVVCVLNRSGAKYGVVEQQLNKHFGGNVIFRIPNASALNWQCSTRGTLATLEHPNHPYSKAVRKLAEQLSLSLEKHLQ